MDLNLTIVSNVPVHLHLHYAQDAVAQGIADIKSALAVLTQQGIAMTKEFDALDAAVTNQATVDASIEALGTSLSAQIQSLKDDPAKLQALADKLSAEQATVAAYVLANTPVDPSQAAATAAAKAAADAAAAQAAADAQAAASAAAAQAASDAQAAQAAQAAADAKAAADAQAAADAAAATAAAQAAAQAQPVQP